MIPARNRRKYAEGDTVTTNPFAGTIPEQKTTLTPEETIQSTPLVEQPTETLDINTGQLGATPATVAQTTGTNSLNVAIPATQQANTYSAYTTLNTPTAVAAQGSVDSRSLVGEPSMLANATALEQGVSTGSQAQAAQGSVSSLGTVQGQVSVRKVNAIMNQRGLGASSMASAAITNAIYESAIPIATQDAKTYSAIDLSNLNNRQQAALQNATVYAAMDKANLDARMTAAVQNSKTFLQTDLTNMTEQNKLNSLDFQARMQDLLADQAAVNAAEQFNAKSNTQVMEFFAELGTQIENANKTREAAMQQFNVSEENAIGKFNSQLEDTRDKFNSQMSTQISQANASWRRNINTANTELANETNRINAQNLLSLNQAAHDQLWQRYRDEANWVVSTAENGLDRAHKVALLGQQNTYDTAAYKKERNDILLSQVADFTFGTILGKITGS